MLKPSSTRQWVVFIAREMWGNTCSELNLKVLSKRIQVPVCLLYGSLGSWSTVTWQLLTCALYLDIYIVLTLFSNTPIQPRLTQGSLFHSFFSDWKEHFILKTSKSKPMLENVIDSVYDWSIGAGLFNLFLFLHKRLKVTCQYLCHRVNKWSLSKTLYIALSIKTPLIENYFT